MGLFDKLKETVNVAIGSAPNVTDPLADPVIKKYFEIICGMRNTFITSSSNKVSGYIKAKKYIEYFLKSPCDEEKLQKALELYNLSCKDYPQSKIEIMATDFRKKVEKSNAYCLERYYANALFCQEEIDMAANEYDEILNVIKNNVNYGHFSQGLSKMQYSSIIKNLVISQSFCTGNSITQKLVLEYLMDSFVCRINSERYNSLYDIHDDIALLTIRALNFEKCHGNLNEYKPISKDDYYSFILSVPYYSGVIENNPFEKERYISRFVNDISSGKVFYGLYLSYKDGFYLDCAHDYFGDFACNLLWKKIASERNWLNENGEDVSESTRAKDIFGMFFAYFRNPYKTDDLEEEEFDELEEEEFFDDEEFGDVEVYNTTSDDVRSLLEAIDLEDE